MLAGSTGECNTPEPEGLTLSIARTGSQTVTFRSMLPHHTV